MFKFKKALFSLVIILFYSVNSIAAEDLPNLPLEEYLSQVKNQNLSYLAAEQNSQAYELLKKKAKLVTGVILTAGTQSGFAEQNQALQIFRYNETYTQSNQVGLSQTSTFGINTQLSYTLNHITYKGLNTSAAPNPSLAASNYQAIPKIAVTIPLWQNLLGSATQASQDSVYFSNESQKLSAKSVSLQSLVAAEKAYWMLVYTRCAAKIQETALKSAEQILTYVSKREKMNLGEKADVLQAKALFESKKLALKQAENDRNIAARNFNRYRYIDSVEVSENLGDFDLTKLQNFLVPKIKAENRYDVKAQEASMKAAVAAAKLDEENNKPSLNLYGSYSVNQVQSGNTQAINNSFAQVGKVGMVGLNFSTPINFFNTSDIRKGDRETASAAKTNYRQKILDQENDWQNLVQNLAIYKENLKLAQSIEAVQKAKLENERYRLKQGRTSTYQVLLFEQDYSNSQLATIQIADKMLEAVADQKLYQP